MKISFLTSCLEPEHDGVGDYTRLLAAECKRAGHATCLIALNDSQCGQVHRDQRPLRLSAALPWADRIKIAKEYLDDFSPDFVSLQFVCYGFHPRGIDWSLAGSLKSIIGSVPVQVMFHELWIGGQIGASLKDRFLGILQRRGVLNILQQLNVRVVHTSNPAYVALLQSHGIKATRLPLFGNIPISNPSTEPREGWTFGMFGTLHPGWPMEPLLGLLSQSGKQIEIRHIGRIGAGAALWESMAEKYAGVFEFRREGEQPRERVAESFSTLDFGIATSPWELIGKSGTVAAMLENGLPVIVNRDEIHYKGWQPTGYSPLLVKMDDRLLTKLANMHRQPGRSTLPEICGQFMSDAGLSASNARPAASDARPQESDP